MPNNDIFNPPTEENQSQGRDLQRTKPIEVPPATVGNVPKLSEAAVHQQVTKNPDAPIVSNDLPFPVQPNLDTTPSPSQTATPPPPSQPTQPVQQETAQNGQDPAQFNVPAIVDANKYMTVSGGQAAYIDPSIDLKNGALYNQGQLDVNTLIQNNQGIPYVARDNLPDTSHSLDGQIERVGKMRQDAQSNWDKYYQTRTAVINEDNYKRQADQSLIPKVPTIDGDVASKGLSSQLARSLQETFDPKKVNNTVGSITDWLFRDTGNLLNKWWDTTENLGDKDTGISKVIKTGISYALNPIGNLEDKFFPKWKAEQDAQHEKGFQETMLRIGNKKEDGQIRDYGTAGLVSSALRLGNTAWSAVNGLAYDIIDNTVIRLANGGRDPHKGLRVLQAITDGRDWGLENQWSAEKYLSWSEPEDIRGKGKTPVDYFSKADPNNIVPGFIKESARRWWDAPENTGELLTRKLDKQGNLTNEIDKKQYDQVIRPLHWLIQGVPTYTVSFAGNGGLDSLVGMGKSAIMDSIRPVRKALRDFNTVVEGAELGAQVVAKANQISKDLPDGLGIAVPRELDNVVGKAAPSITRPVKQNVRQLIKEDPILTEEFLRFNNPDKVNDIVIPIKHSVPTLSEPKVATLNDYVTHTVKSPLLDSPELVPNRLLETSSRNSDDITILAKRMMGDDGKPLLDVNRSSILSDNEIGALRNLDNINLSEHGLPVAKHLDEANVLDLGNGLQVEIPKYPHLRDDNLSYDGIMGITEDNAYQKYQKLTERLKGAETFEEQASIQNQRLVAVAKLADKGEAYQALQSKFPSLLRGETPDIVEQGNTMISREVQLAGEGSELRQLDMNVRDLQKKTVLLREQMEMYPLFRQDLNSELATKEIYSGETSSVLQNVDRVDDVPLPREPLVRTPEMTDSKLLLGTDLEPKWQHGTTSTADIRRVDPVNGASSSELGKGVYLTTDGDVSKAAALKGNLENRPYPTNHPDDFSKPRIHNVDVTSLNNVLDGSQPMGSLRKNWHISAQSAILDTTGVKVKLDLPMGTNLEDMFNQFKIQYMEKMGHPPSELTTSTFQTNLTKALVDSGVEGLYTEKNGIKTLAVYNPSQLKVDSTLSMMRDGTTLETLEAKRFLEGVTAQQLGDDVSLANYFKSQKDLGDYQLQRAVEAKLSKEQHISELISDVTDLENNIVSKNLEIHQSSMRDTIDNVPSRINKDYSEPIQSIMKDPC